MSLLTNMLFHLSVASLMLSLSQCLLQSLQRQLHVLLLIAGEDPPIPAVLVAVILGSLIINLHNLACRCNNHISVLVDELVQLLLSLIRVLDQILTQVQP